MKISAVRVLELNERYHLIENLADRELNNPEGAGFDLRVGQIHKLAGDSFLGIKERHSPSTELLGDIEIDGEKEIVIKPGEYFLVTTMETLNSPSEKIKYDEFFPEAYIKPIINPRSSLQRGGVSLHFTKTDPGYKGKLTFGIKNLGNQDFKFQLGARMFNVEFEPVVGELNRAYSGQHQGGRVTSQGEKEIQN